MKKSLLLVLSFLCLFMISSCSKISKISGEVPLENISIIAEKNANHCYATAVDLVVIFDQELDKKIGQLPAEKYFQSAEQLQRDNQEQMISWRWEVVPGQVLISRQIEMESCLHPISAYVFARYMTKGDHRIKLPAETNLIIYLENENFKIKKIIDDTSIFCSKTEQVDSISITELSRMKNREKAGTSCSDKPGSCMK